MSRLPDLFGPKVKDLAGLEETGKFPVSGSRFGGTTDRKAMSTAATTSGQLRRPFTWSSVMYVSCDIVRGCNGTAGTRDGSAGIYNNRHSQSLDHNDNLSGGCQQADSCGGDANTDSGIC